MAQDSRSPRWHLLYACDIKSYLQYLVDTEVEVSLIPASREDKLLPTSGTLEAANCSPINIYGECPLILLFRGASHTKMIRVFLIADAQQTILAAEFLSYHGFTVILGHRSLVQQSGTCIYAVLALVLHLHTAPIGISSRNFQC